MPGEPTLRETAKQRSLRVPLDYCQRPSRLAHAKIWLTTLAAALAATYAVWLVAGGRTSREQISPGELAAAHATWSNECQVCHQDFRPLRPDALRLTALGASDEAAREALDQACLVCHNVPAHHSSARPEEVPSCAACHREHQGAATDIVRPPDAMCVACHHDLSRHRTAAAPAFSNANVTGFGVSAGDAASPHPEFRSLASDPGNIKFNHWLHLQPGIAVGDAKRKFSLNDVREADRPRFEEFAKADQLLQLDCTACHEPQADGRLMQPISFERHCRACHVLEVKEGNTAGVIEVPHGLPAERLAATLDGLVFAAERAAEPAPAPTADESGALPLIPGKTLGNNLAQKISRDLLGRRGAVAAAVQAKCQQCHVPADGQPAGSDFPRLEPAAIPSIWLRHGRFDHSAHRHVQCRSCHADAFAFEQRDKPQFIAPPPGAVTARDDQQVMIAGLTKCVTCHTPARGGQGGARHDCAQCHAYHEGDQRLASLRSSFPGAPLGTHALEARASSPSVEPPEIRLVHLLSADPTTERLVGISSCAASNCHGGAAARAPAWHSAFTSFAAHDPHVQATNVLWTYRAREMTRRLSPAAGRTEPLTDAEHHKQLAARCLGCHATPAAIPTADTRNELAGVWCESCHGPASGWQHAHYRANFDRKMSAGFVDTKDVAQRAAVCLPCHVGPAGGTQPVDHDLIAAGHPRLAFDFHTYLERLPAHWDRQADERRHPGDFHFQAWLAGEQQRRIWQASQPPSADFASRDCFDCHHQLEGSSWRQSFPSEPLAAPTQPPVPLPSASPAKLSIDGRLALVRSLLADTVRAPAFDAAVHALLATRAVLSDLARTTAPQAAAELKSCRAAADALGDYLSRDCFDQPAGKAQPITPYDSPNRFDPAALAERVQPLVACLARLEALSETQQEGHLNAVRQP